VRKSFDDFIISKSVSFHYLGIRKLPERQQKIINNNDEYF
ncbi:hypothetical protein EAI_08365, partial [Harpegnathos saltator]